MRYLLVVLTHGDHSDDLVRTYEAFLRNVKPWPTTVYLHGDGEMGQASTYDLALRYPLRGVTYVHGGSQEQRGFCDATRDCWTEGATGDHTHTFHLEHDFLVTRPVDLTELAAILDANPTLAQMALMRDAVNAEEKAAGGLFESRPGQYELREGWYWTDAAGNRTAGRPLDPKGPVRRPDDVVHPFAWQEHRAYLTTNPSLMRREFMAANPWPIYPAECEGRFGIDLVRRGYSFGVWGDGSPWCEHIGERTGHGY